MVKISLVLAFLSYERYKDALERFSAHLRTPNIGFDTRVSFTLFSIFSHVAMATTHT